MEIHCSGHIMYPYQILLLGFFFSKVRLINHIRCLSVCFIDIIVCIYIWDSIKCSIYVIYDVLRKSK